MKIISISLPIILSIIIAGCSPEKNSESKEATMAVVTASNAVYSLNQIIDFQRQPESVKFQTATQVPKTLGANGLENWGLVALLKFSEEDLKYFIDKTTPADSKSLPENFAFPWLKPTLENDFKFDASSNSYVYQKGALKAESFYRFPLIHGTSFQISSTEILIYLHTQ